MTIFRNHHDLDTIKRDIIEAKKQGMGGAYLVKLPYITGQKTEETKEWVSIDVHPDFESKKAKLVFSDNFEEEHCLFYIPYIRHTVLEKWGIEEFYAMGRYGEQIPVVNRYLLKIGCITTNQESVMTQEIAESFGDIDVNK